MKGIYLTPEGKEEIETKIAELEIDLENHIQHCKMNGSDYDYQFEQEIEIYKEILSSATILPVEESWRETIRKSLENFQVDGKDSTLEGNYPNGVIIQPKQ